MEIAPSIARICRLALVGVGVAFAWILIAFALGLGGADAHASEAEDDSGVLGAVTSLLDTTTTSLTQTVSTVGSGVTDAVAAVVVATPAPVQAPVRDVVASTGAVVTAVAQPVAEVLGSGVATAVVEPVVTGVVSPTVGLVSEVPVVGGLVTALGLERALLDVSATLDTTLGSTIDVVIDVTNPVVLPAAGAQGGSPADVVLSPASYAVVIPNVAESFAAYAFDRVTAAVATSAATSALTSSAPVHTAGLCLPSSATSGPAGAGSGAWALVAVVPLAAHRAWVRRAGPSNDDVPTSPAQSADVSPD